MRRYRMAIFQTVEKMESVESCKASQKIIKRQVRKSRLKCLIFLQLSSRGFHSCFSQNILMTLQISYTLQPLRFFTSLNFQSIILMTPPKSNRREFQQKITLILVLPNKLKMVPVSIKPSRSSFLYCFGGAVFRRCPKKKPF